MKVVIVEDEINAQQALQKMLQLAAPHLLIVGVYTSVNQALEYLNNNQIDLLLLDIQLEDGTGFDLLNQLTQQHFALVFTTAYNEYAIKAFKFSAIDYLLKPIDPIELKNTINRVQKQHKNQLTAIAKNKSDQKIILKTIENRYIIPVTDILYLEADGAYTIFHTINDRIMVSKNLKFYEQLLHDFDFIRCHQSYFVARSHIKILKKTSLILTNNSEVPISSRKRRLFN